MDMDDATIQALQKSIDHWQRFADGTSAPTERPYASHCALCQRFFDVWDDEGNRLSCTSCPVFLTTGQEECGGSPYEDARDAFVNHGKESIEFRAAAALELAFLKSLMPPE